MIICEVNQDNKIYTFKAPCLIERGIYVMCDTIYGEKPGMVVDSFEVTDTESKVFEKYLEARGAYLPLKDVTGIFIPLRWLSANAKASEYMKR